MPDDQNSPQNPISEENSIPASPQEPTEPAPENSAYSEPSVMPPETLEAPRNADIPVSLNNDNLENEPVSTPNPEVAKPEELPTEGEKTEEIPEPMQTPEPQTAQILGNEPLASELEVKPEPIQTQTSQPKIFLARELLIKARNAIQFRKHKKLDKVMSLFLRQSKITNDEVEKLLHVSDATATRYLDILEKEGKIKQNGKIGKAVTYSLI